MRKALIEFHEKHKVLLEQRKYYLYDLNMALEIYSYYDINEYGMLAYQIMIFGDIFVLR